MKISDKQLAALSLESAKELLSIYRAALLEISSTPDKDLSDDARWMKRRAKLAFGWDEAIENKSNPLAALPHSYSYGNNPWDKDSYYCCDDCGLELFGEEVGYVVAGTEYASGECAPCPRCGEEGVVERPEI